MRITVNLDDALVSQAQASCCLHQRCKLLRESNRRLNEDAAESGLTYLTALH